MVLQPHMQVPRKAKLLAFSEVHWSFQGPWVGGHDLQHQLAEDETSKPTCEMELWLQVLFICSQFAWGLVMLIIMGLYVWAIRGCSVLTTGVSPLCRISTDWTMYSYYPMCKEELDFCCNTVWSMYILDYGEKWPITGSLNCCTIMKLEHHCQRLGKWDEILYVQAFKILHNWIFAEPEFQQGIRCACRPHLRTFSCLIQS